MNRVVAGSLSTLRLPLASGVAGLLLLCAPVVGAQVEAPPEVTSATTAASGDEEPSRSDGPPLKPARDEAPPPAALTQEGSELPVPPTQRRGGFVLGASLNYGTGFAAGYPNKIQEIGDPDFRTELNTPFYAGLSLFLGGAIRDWLTVALTMASGGAQQDDSRLGGFMLGLRIESFPAYSLGGAWRDVGLVTQFGVGSNAVLDQEDKVIADGGSMRSLGVGAFFQPLRWWHMGFGPGVMYLHQSSDSMHINMFSLGLRAVFYGEHPGTKI
jgi:hypothetical protein